MTPRMVIFTFVIAAILLTAAIYIAWRTWWTIENDLAPPPQSQGYTTSE